MSAMSEERAENVPLSLTVRDAPFSVVNRIVEGKNISEGQISKCLVPDPNKCLLDTSLSRTRPSCSTTGRSSFKDPAIAQSAQEKQKKLRWFIPWGVKRDSDCKSRWTLLAKKCSF